MSFRVLSRDEALQRAGIRAMDPEIEVTESPRRSTGHSRGQSESRHLLPDPQNLFEYSATSHFRFPDRGIDAPAPISRQSDPRFPDWSIEPESLRRSRRQWWRDLFLDVLMLAIGLPFFALAGAVIRVNARVTGKHELNVLEQCIRGAATLFPLIFSVVVGRTLVKLASWKLERGAALGLLERLMGSRTVGGTLATQFRLQSLSLVAIALIFLWLLSPLGSQAVLRILSTATKPMTSPANVTYVNTRQPSYSGDPIFQNTWFSGFASLFSATLVASPQIKNGSMDVWGNVKIPYFSSLESGEDSDGWRQIAQNTNTTIYSSLFGIPISGLPTGNTTLNIESTYLELTCRNITSNITRNGSEFYNSGLISTNGPFKSAQNVTAQTPWAIGYLGSDVTALLPPELYGDPLCLDCLPDNVTSMTFFPGLLLYQDFEGAQNVTSIYCTPSQVYVESIIVCNRDTAGQTCAVTAQRLSTLPHMPSELTSLSFAQTVTGLTALLPSATQQISHVDLMQNYIVNPDDSTFIQSTSWPAFPSSSNATNSTTESRFLNITLQDFGQRLGQFINSFLFGSFPNSTGFLTHSSILPNNTNGRASPQTNLLSSIQNLTATFTVPANITSEQEVYVCNYPWIGVFVGASLAVPLAAIAAAVLGRMTKARGYLGYVSSLVRESEYGGMPKGEVNLDGVEMARKLRNLRVRLGDVGDIDRGFEIGTGVALTVGQLAIGEEGATKKIDRRKLYI